MQTLLWVCPEQSFWVEGWRSLMVQMHFASTWTCAKELWDAWLPLLPRLFLSWPAAGIAKFHGAFWIGKRWQQKPSLPPLPREPIDMPISLGNRWVTASMFTRTNPITNPMTSLLWFAKAICYFQCLMFVPATFTQFTPFRLQWTLWLLRPAWRVSCSILALWLGAVQNPQPATKESPNEEDPWGHLSHLSHLPNHRWTGSRSF